ncbi:MAG: hypothetical protein N2315_06090 [Thermanaerothrix sp.]|nr:hypothetical protein [Thermanaerothrix sp.]
MTLDPLIVLQSGLAQRLMYAGLFGLAGAFSPCFLVTAPLTVAVVAV